MPNDLQAPESVKKLREGFEALREVASPRAWNAGAKDQLLPALSALKAIAQKLESEGRSQAPSSPRGISLEEAREQWHRHTTSHDPDQLERRAVRRLCWDPEIAATAEFLCFLERDEQSPSAPMILGLLGVYHFLWEAPNDNLERRLSLWLREYSGYNPSVRRLAEASDEVLGRNAPLRASRSAAAKNELVRHLLEERGLALNTAYASAVAAELLHANLQTLERTRDFNQACYICTQLLRPKKQEEKQAPSDRDLLRPEAFAQAVRRLVTVGAANVDLREVVKDFALDEPTLGDPRRHPSNWDNKGLSVEAGEIRGWLSEEDLKFFFDLIMEGREDRQERRKFWLKYVYKARDFRVAIGRMDRQRLRLQLLELKKRGRTYASLHDWDNSAFVMDFGAAIAVDFSVVGACFIYDERTGRKKIGSLRSGEFGLNALKEGTTYSGRFRHVGFWMDKVQQYLAREYGIRE